MTTDRDEDEGWDEYQERRRDHEARKNDMERENRAVSQ
jgi:hypothetical protein